MCSFHANHDVVGKVYDVATAIFDEFSPEMANFFTDVAGFWFKYYDIPPVWNVLGVDEDLIMSLRVLRTHATILLMNWAFLVTCVKFAKTEAVFFFVTVVNYFLLQLESLI